MPSFTLFIYDFPPFRISASYYLNVVDFEQDFVFERSEIVWPGVRSEI